MIDSATGERKGQQMGFSLKKKKEYSKAQAKEEKGLDFIKIKTSSLQRTLLRKWKKTTYRRGENICKSYA